MLLCVSVALPLACDLQYRLPMHTSGAHLPVRRAAGCNGRETNGTARHSGVIVLLVQTEHLGQSPFGVHPAVPPDLPERKLSLENRLPSVLPNSCRCIPAAFGSHRERFPLYP